MTFTRGRRTFRTALLGCGCHDRGIPDAGQSLENALYWIDIKKPALYRYDAETGGQRSWLMPSDIGAFALVSHPPAPWSRCDTECFDSNSTPAP